jgi:hypothetical protein
MFWSDVNSCCRIFCCMGLYVYRVTRRHSKLTNSQIVPVTPTALKERAGIAEGDGTFPFPYVVPPNNAR